MREPVWLNSTCLLAQLSISCPVWVWSELQGLCWLALKLPQAVCASHVPVWVLCTLAECALYLSDACVCMLLHRLQCMLPCSSGVLDSLSQVVPGVAVGLGGAVLWPPANAVSSWGLWLWVSW